MEPQNSPSSHWWRGVVSFESWKYICLLLKCRMLRCVILVNVEWVDWLRIISLIFPSRTHGKHIIMNCKEIGRLPPTFGDASIVASELLNSGYEFDQGSVIFNRFRWESLLDFISLDKSSKCPKLSIYWSSNEDMSLTGWILNQFHLCPHAGL